MSSLPCCDRTAPDSRSSSRTPTSRSSSSTSLVSLDTSADPTMTPRPAVDEEIRDLIRDHGRITFAQFMQVCLYSRRGGFYASRAQRISAHFGTSSMTHPVFGALIARQLEQMWQLLGEPRPFHVIEVGCGDGALAQS